MLWGNHDLPLLSLMLVENRAAVMGHVAEITEVDVSLAILLLVWVLVTAATAS